MSQAQANKELVRRFFDAGNERDFDALDELLTADFTRHCPATPGVEVNCPDDFKRFMRQDIASVPDARVEVRHLLAEGDMVAVWANYSGTQEGPFGPFPASGKFCSTDFGGVFRVEDGRLAELWVTWDNLDILVQLGHIEPPPAPAS
jgi:steroid delta-isomerase-like uncharacterized protein